MRRALLLALFTVPGLVAADSPRVFILDPHILQQHRKDPELAEAARTAADKAMKQGPYSVLDKSRTPPSGSKHDYLSQAPYWWPDPAKPDGLPYIRKDGQRNPEINGITDHTQMDGVNNDSLTLALAWYLTGKEEYAEHAALLLRTWFLDPKTRMNPNQNYGQYIPGITDGRGTGIIETRGFTSSVDAAGLLAGSKSWTAADQKGLEQWFADFAKWLRESPNGKDEAMAANNHGTFYDVQVADFLLFSHQDALAKQLLEESRAKRIAAQIEPDGRQPLETDRTRGISYSVMNLNGLILLATLGERVGVDFWGYQTADGRSIRKALDWLVPYSAGDKKWPYEQIEAYNPSDLAPALLRAALHYPGAGYRQRVNPKDVTRDVPSRLLGLADGK